MHAPADGYTLIQLNVANAINVSLYDKLSFDVLRDLVPVASFMRVPNVMEVSPTLPVKTVPEFIAYARANPGKVMPTPRLCGEVPGPYRQHPLEAAGLAERF